MAIDLYDMILGAGVMFLIYATIKYFKKNKRFVHCETTEGECSEVRSIRYNFIVCMNRYFYAYTVDGVFYSGEDSEAFWFRYKRRNLTNPVTVEYLKDSPETSRLAVVNHKNELQVIMILLLAVIWSCARTGFCDSAGTRAGTAGSFSGTDFGKTIFKET